MQALEVAKIVKPQGIKGEVKAQPLTNVLAVFIDLKNCIIDGKQMQIEHIVLRQGFLYIQFAGVADRNAAEALRNKEICIDKSLLRQKKQNGDFLIDDLIGMRLYDLEGLYVGQIMDIENYGSCDIFILDCDGRHCEAPYVKDVFVQVGDALKVDRTKFDEVAIW